MDRQSRLSKLRENYVGLNNLHLSVRVKKSVPIERWIIDTMNYHGVVYNGLMLRGWSKTGDTDDRKMKRDAIVVNDGRVFFSQNKWRQPDSGTDVGCALFEPYPGRAEIVRCIKEGHGAIRQYLARDYKFDGSIYTVLNNSWENLIIVPYKELVKDTYAKVLLEWLREGEELDTRNRCFRSKQFSGAQLRWKSDSGRGYHAGYDKILAYLPVSVFTSDERAKVVEMIDPPDYLFEE